MYYITTSRPYTNALPHLGTVMDPIYADAYTRFRRQMGDKVFFSMGTDEHSFKIANRAIELGLPPQEYANNQYELFDICFKSLDIQADNFIQSSDPKHKWTANLIWNVLVEKNLIYKKKYSGLYCIGCEDFYAESQLVKGKCPVHFNLEIQNVEEDNYFFKLTSFKTELIEYLNKVKINNPSIKIEMLNFVDDLKDISISRDKSRLEVEWGVVVEADPTNLMYVWFEALITYLTPLIPDELHENYLESDSDIKTTIEKEIFNIFKTELPQKLQVIGTDNSKFHLVIWPAILIALDLPPIESLIIHGMVNDSEGKKFAKSLGNGIEYQEVVDKLGAEGVRFFVLNYCNSNSDTNFDWNKLIENYNACFVKNLGNLVMRITTLIEKNLNGIIDIEIDFVTNIDIDISKIYSELETLRPENASRQLFIEISKINNYLEQTKPWALAKNMEENQNKILEILSSALLSLKSLLPALSIFYPKAAERIDLVISSDLIQKSEILFERIEQVI